MCCMFFGLICRISNLLMNVVLFFLVLMLLLKYVILVMFVLWLMWKGVIFILMLEFMVLMFRC